MSRFKTKYGKSVKIHCAKEGADPLDVRITVNEQMLEFLMEILAAQYSGTNPDILKTKLVGLVDQWTEACIAQDEAFGTYSDELYTYVFEDS